MMMTELRSRLMKMECAEVSVAVMPGNLEAIRFYKRQGLIEEALLLENHLEL